MTTRQQFVHVGFLKTEEPLNWGNNNILKGTRL